MHPSIYIHYIHTGTCRSQKRMSYPLELELKAVVNAATQTQVLWQSSEHSELLGCLSSPHAHVSKACSLAGGTILESIGDEA